MEQLFQESQEHILKSGTWAVPKYIDADKASALCPAGHPHTPGKDCGDLFPTSATSPRHFVQAPVRVSSVKLWIPGAEVPEDPCPV